MTVRSLSVRYYGRDVDALADLDLDVRAGELVGVAGRNGAGKSTLALVTAGLIPRIIRARVSGDVLVDSEPVLGTVPARRQHLVGIVFSSPHNQISATKSTVREELAFGLENLGVPRAKMLARIERALADLRIEHLAERYPFELSGGEQQRVAIASVLVMGTQVLVLDEPTAQLDPGSASAVGNILVERAGTGIAVLVAEHAPAILGRTARCLVLDGGRLAGLDHPGAALGSAALTALDLRPPTIVRLAEWAGLPASAAFDESAIADALRRALESDTVRPAPTGEHPISRREPPRPLAWEPVRVHAPSSVEILGLDHRYPNGVEAVRRIDLRIEPGSRVAIVGQNGSGKTTLVKHLNGLLRPSAGDVQIAGRSIAGVPVDRLAATVGFVFQDPDDQLFNRSVEREVAFGPRNLGLDGAKLAALVNRALEVTGLTHVRAANPYDLGLSNRKLIALASVLAMDPSVLVLDEPTTGQDEPGVWMVGGIVDAFSAAGRTVIAITHDMEFAASHFGRVVVMRQGEVVLDGAPVEVFAPDRGGLLASTGLEPPVAARIGARLGLGATPTEAALVEALTGGRLAGGQ